MRVSHIVAACKLLVRIEYQKPEPNNLIRQSRVSDCEMHEIAGGPAAALSRASLDHDDAGQSLLNEPLI